MSFLSTLFRCLCLCIVFEKGTWYPNERPKTSKRKLQAINKQVYNKKVSKVLKNSQERPAWLNEWTISKGWVHNKSHMLELRPNHRLEEMEGIQSETSSISSQNIDELVSLESNVEKKVINQIRIPGSETDDSAEYTSEDEATIRISSIQRQHNDDIFEKLSENYRNNFPQSSKNQVWGSFQLPQVYKEHLLYRQNKHANILNELWKRVKTKKNKTCSYDCKFTENEIFENKDVYNTLASTNSRLDTMKFIKKKNLAKNIALYNDLNLRRNLHEETIYECSEENSNQTSLNNIYHNPIYSQSSSQMISIYDRRIAQYQNHLKQSHDSSRSRSDKYVIRHIKVRIMLSLRVGKVQKVKKSQRNIRQFFGRKRENSKRQIMQVDGDLKSKVARMHAEQRRIGNGRTSVKIQNMR